MIDFKVGKWYKFEPYKVDPLADSIYVIKCHSLANEWVSYEEYINLKTKEHCRVYSNSIKQNSNGWIEEISVEDISQYLPINHDDLIYINPEKSDYIELIRLLKECI